MKKQRVAILGGGPIGVETAARVVREGHEVAVYETGTIGEHVRKWDHVRFFSPWALNRSGWGKALLAAQGVELAPEDEFPTGEEYRRRYLEPLLDAISEKIELHEDTKVLGVTRKEALKGDFIGDSRRTKGPFLIRVQGPQGVRFDEADIVIDATGVLSQPNWLGPGGLPALGEEKLNGEVIRRIPDVDGEDKGLAGRRVLVVGNGHSAMTSLDRLTILRETHPDTEVVWAFRHDASSREEIENDPLPERARLDRLGNLASLNQLPGVEALAHSMVRAIQTKNDRLEVILERPEGMETVTVDRVVSNVGYRPDTSLTRELQVHLCYASDGPMKLAASLMGADSADCLDQEAGGADTLANPEPDFYVLGAKSYGRNSNFLLKVGFGQIEAMMELWS